MKSWIVRFASLYVFNVVVLLVIGWVLSTVRVGWAALWASVILTAATIWLKPAIGKAFSNAAAKSSSSRTAAGEKLVQYGAVLLVELIIWVLVVLFSGVQVRGFVWGWVLPPVLLLIAWIIYDAIDDRVEAKTAGYYDRAEAGIRGTNRAGGGVASTAPATGAAARTELDDGLTPEQRKMLDDLGT